MKKHTPHINPHKLARLTVWAQLKLVWLMGVCAAWMAAGRVLDARALDAPSRMVRCLILAHVLATLNPRRHGLHRHGRHKHVRLRTLLGARLRRLTRNADGPARLFAMLAVVRDRARHIARLARRLRNGLTRLRVIVPVRASVIAPIGDVHAAAASADTS